jgi:hypothetical protein
LAHRAREQQKVRGVYDDAVRDAIGKVAKSGVYPSLQRILFLVSQRNPSLTSYHLTNLAIKRIRVKL